MQGDENVSLVPWRILRVYVSPYFYLLTAFVGVNLVLAGTTGVCFSWAIFKKLGVPPGRDLR